MPSAVLDLDLEVRGDPSSRSLDGGRWGGGGPPKNFFRPFGPQFGLKIGGGGQGGPPGPFPGSATVQSLCIKCAVY